MITLLIVAIFAFIIGLCGTYKAAMKLNPERLEKEWVNVLVILTCIIILIFSIGAIVHLLQQLHIR